MSGAGRRLVGGMMLAAAAGSAVAGQGSPVGAGAPPDDAAAPRLLVEDQTYALEPGAAFEATLSISAPSATVAALTGEAAEIRVTVHEAITDATQLGPIGAGDQPAVDLAVLAASPVLAASGGGAEGVLSVPVSDGGGGRDSIDLAEPGIYPLTIDVAAGSIVATASTYIELVDPDSPSPPLSVAILTAPGDADDYRRLADVARDSDAPLTVSLLPSIAETADNPVESLRFDELLALPAAPLDPSAVVAVDEADAFTRMLREGEDALSVANPLAVVSRAAWIADRPISGPGAAMLRDLGVRILVLTDDVAASLGAETAGAVFEVDLGDGDSLPAMRIDRRGAQLAAGQPGEASATPNDRAVRLLAELRLSQRGGGPPLVVLGAPGLAVPDAEVTARFADLVERLPDASVVPLSRLPGIAQGQLRSDGPTLELPDTAGADLTVRRAGIAVAREAANHASSMIVGSPRRDDWRRRLDALLASDIDDATAEQRLAELDDEFDSVLTAIVAPEPFTFTLTGSSNTLRLPLRNTATEPLRVAVAVRSAKLVIDEPTQVVEVPALSSVDVDVPVRARSQGTFTIEVDVVAPDGNRLGTPVVLKGRVNHARGLSQVATGGAALVLASWWYMHLRRRRTRRRPALSSAGD